MTQLHLLGKRELSLAQYLKATCCQHEAWAAIIEPNGSEQSIYDRYLFAFLSINTAFAPNCEAYERMRGRYWTDTEETEQAIRLSPSVAFAPTKARDIVAFTKRYLAHPRMFRCRTAETPAALRDRLNIQGLGQAKLSFALALACPTTSNVVCLDRHVQRWATGKNRNGLSPRLYGRIEDALVKVGQRYGVSAFVAQWCVWDWMRGHEESHEQIADKEGECNGETEQADRLVCANTAQ